MANDLAILASIWSVFLIIAGINSENETRLSNSTSFYPKDDDFLFDTLENSSRPTGLLGELVHFPDPVGDLQSCTEAKYKADYPCGGDDFQEMRQHGTCILVADVKADGWEDARERCRALNGDLVQIPDRSFDEGLDNLSAESPGRWIGLHDDDHNSRFSWLDEGHDATYFNWAQTNANTYYGQFCVTKGAWHDGAWNQDQCDKADRGFICQRYSDRELHESPLKNYPTLQVNYTTVSLGDKILADCEALIDDGGQICFRFWNLTRWELVKPADNQSIVLEDGVYVMNNSRCYRRWRSQLMLMFTSGMIGYPIQCCSVRNVGPWKCASSYPLRLQHAQMELVLLLQSVSIVLPLLVLCVHRICSSKKMLADHREAEDNRDEAPPSFARYNETETSTCFGL